MIVGWVGGDRDWAIGWVRRRPGMELRREATTDPSDRGDALLFLRVRIQIKYLLMVSIVGESVHCGSDACPSQEDRSMSPSPASNIDKGRSGSVGYG